VGIKSEAVIRRKTLRLPLRVIAHRLLYRVPLGACFLGQPRIGLAFQMSQLLLHLLEVCQPGRVKCCGRDGATGLGSMCAVSETAVLRECLDVVEAGLKLLRWLLSIRPQLYFAKTWQIHKEPAAGHAEKLASGGSVSATAVRGADGVGPLALVPQQAVENCRFADT